MVTRCFVMMKCHFIAENGTAACGKNDHDLFGTDEVGRVNCKACKCTNIYRRALFLSGKNTKNIGLLPEVYWKNYIQNLPGKNTFPRGMY